MGSANNKPEKEQAQEIETSTGFHLFEVHAPTAGFSVATMVVLFILAMGFWLLRKKCQGQNVGRNEWFQPHQQQHIFPPYTLRGLMDAQQRSFPPFSPRQRIFDVEEDLYASLRRPVPQLAPPPKCFVETEEETCAPVPGSRRPDLDRIIAKKFVPNE